MTSGLVFSLVLLMVSVWGILFEFGLSLFGLSFVSASVGIRKPRKNEPNISEFFYMIYVLPHTLAADLV